VIQPFEHVSSTDYAQSQSQSCQQPSYLHPISVKLRNRQMLKTDIPYIACKGFENSQTAVAGIIALQNPDFNLPAFQLPAKEKNSGKQHLVNLASRVGMVARDNI
jgi:hypothetical protein